MGLPVHSIALIGVKLDAHCFTTLVKQVGEDVLRDFERGRYQVAFIDLGMPGMAGDQVALALKKWDPTLVTVLMTGWRLEDNDAHLLPFDFRIDKPFSNEAQFKEIIQESLVHYQKQQQA